MLSSHPHPTAAHMMTWHEAYEVQGNQITTLLNLVTDLKEVLRLGEGNFNHAAWHAREKLRDCSFWDDDTMTQYEFEPGEEEGSMREKSESEELSDSGGEPIPLRGKPRG